MPPFQRPVSPDELYNPAPMNSVTVYVIQAGLSFLMLFLLVRWFIGSYLAAQPIRKAMLVLLSPHIAHHVGLAVLVPGVVGAGFPANFLHWAITESERSSPLLFAPLILYSDWLFRWSGTARWARNHPAYTRLSIGCEVHPECH